MAVDVGEKRKRLSEAFDSYHKTIEEVLLP